MKRGLGMAMDRARFCPATFGNGHGRGALAIFVDIGEQQARTGGLDGGQDRLRVGFGPGGEGVGGGADQGQRVVRWQHRQMRLAVGGAMHWVLHADI